jgi:hypothetical protein
MAFLKVIQTLENVAARESFLRWGGANAANASNQANGANAGLPAGAGFVVGCGDCPGRPQRRAHRGGNL